MGYRFRQGISNHPQRGIYNAMDVSKYHLTALSDSTKRGNTTSISVGRPVADAIDSVCFVIGYQKGSVGHYKNIDRASP